MRLWANFVSACWGGAVILLACGLYAHNENMITGGIAVFIASTIARLITNSEGGQ